MMLGDLFLDKVGGQSWLLVGCGLSLSPTTPSVTHKTQEAAFLDFFFYYIVSPISNENEYSIEDYLINVALVCFGASHLVSWGCSSGE
jgi:hypothetical protein